jgi:hypothetical protein
MARDQGRRIEIAFALRNGGLLTAIEELEDTLSEALVKRYAEQLREDIANGNGRTFVDAWSASGQHTWVDLREVAAFSLRAAK